MSLCVTCVSRSIGVQLRLVLAAGAFALIAAPIVKPLGLFEVRLFDLGGIFSIAGMATTFVITSGVNARALYLQETTRR